MQQFNISNSRHYWKREVKNPADALHLCGRGVSMESWLHTFHFVTFVSLLLRHNLCLHEFTIAYINFAHVCAHRRTLSDLGGIQTQNVWLHVPHKRQGS